MEKYEFPSQFYQPAPTTNTPVAVVAPAISEKLTAALNGIQLASNLNADPQTGAVNPLNTEGAGWQIYKVAGTVGSIVLAYHGYKRNKSIGWAFGWSIFGGLMPFFALPIAIAQGFGKEKTK